MANKAELIAEQLASAAAQSKIWSDLLFNVKVYGAKGDGVKDDTAAIQKALDAMGGEAGTLYFPRGIYKISSPITLNIRGMKMVGASLDNTYIRTTNPAGVDMVRISNTHIEVSGFNFRPNFATDICIRLYTGMADIHHNRFLAAADNQGNAVIMTDTNPEDGTFVPGAYTHTIRNNYFGTTGFSFARTIETSGTAGGQNANCIIRNMFMGDTCIRIHAGGGNNISFNLMQSSTGTSGAPAGSAVDCVGNVGDVISQNYFEQYQNAILMREASYNIHGIFNHYDNCTNKLYTLSSADYLHIDPDSNTSEEFGWKITNTLNSRSVSNSGVAVQQLGNNYVEDYQSVNTYQNIGVTADNSVITPVTSFHRLNGSGAARAGCSLSTAGAKAGQRLTLYGLTWSVTLIPGTTAVFAGAAASVTFGAATGNILVMELIFDGVGNKWIEVSRSIV